MSRSMKSLCNNLVHRTAGWTASFLAVVAALLGQSGEAIANPVTVADRNIPSVGPKGSDIQISYLQVGVNTGTDQDWWPPLPE